MGEKQTKPFQLSFNGLLKVDFQGSHVTSDGGLILVRELDERLGLGELIDEHLSDSRQGTNKQFTLADLLRQSVYSRLAGYEDLNDAERVSIDPTFRVIGSQKIWDRGAALTSTLHGFETEMLASEENLLGLMALNRELVGQAEAFDDSERVVLGATCAGRLAPTARTRQRTRVAEGRRGRGFAKKPSAFAETVQSGSIRRPEQRREESKRGSRGSDSNGAESHAKRRFPNSLGVGGLALEPRSRIGTCHRD